MYLLNLDNCTFSLSQANMQALKKGDPKRKKTLKALMFMEAYETHRKAVKEIIWSFNFTIL